MGDLATLAVATRAAPVGPAEHGYVFVELVCHASVWLTIGLSLILPRRGRAGPTARLAVRDTHLGKSVFAAVPFARDETIMRFSGRCLGPGRVPLPLAGADDRFVQVAPDEYMGPSGRIDDLVNHHCDPNAGLRFTPGGVLLVVIRPIAAGEEIGWDYSTTVGDPSWAMACRCGGPECRSTVAAFAGLPEERRRWCRARDLVAPYLREPARERAA